jgi:hypothetical protein
MPPPSLSFSGVLKGLPSSTPMDIQIHLKGHRIILDHLLSIFKIEGIQLFPGEQLNVTITANENGLSITNARMQ